MGCVAAALAGAVVAFSSPAFAQSWPNRPVKIVVPLGPGSTLDMGARLLAPALAERLKQPVLVENRPGAAQMTGIASVAQSPPDGYTLLYTGTGLAIGPSLYKVSFDPLNDLMPVTQLAENHLELVVRAGLPVASLNELIALARAKPGTLTCGSSGGIVQMGCELFRSSARLEIVVVPYKSVGQAINDVAAGNVDMVFAVGRGAAPFVESGRLKPLASTGTKRHVTGARSLPPVSDAVPGFVLKGWEGILVPAGTPTEIVARLNREFGSIVAEPDVRRSFADIGVEPVTGTQEDFRRVIAADLARFGKLVRDQGIKPD